MRVADSGSVFFLFVVLDHNQKQVFAGCNHDLFVLGTDSEKDQVVQWVKVTDYTARFTGKLGHRGSDRGGLRVGSLWVLFALFV